MDQKDIIRSGIVLWLSEGYRFLSTQGARGIQEWTRILDTLIKSGVKNETKSLRKAFFCCLNEFYLAFRLFGNSGVVQWQSIMDRALTKGYQSMGAPRNSGPEGFLKYVVERDKFLGLKAGGKILDKTKFSYWIEDPFKPLKGKITSQDYENISTWGYLRTKCHYFTPKHVPKMVKNRFRGDSRTEWILEKLR